MDRQDEITEGASLLPKFPILRLRALGEEGRAAFIEYQRHRVRVARATTFNLGLVLLAGSLFLMRGYNEYPRWPDDWSKAASVFAIATVVLLWASWRAAERIEKAQDKRLADTYGIWREDRALAGAPGAIVSAVCHRRAKDELQVLLVNTKGGRHWTFPKGHVGPGEDPRSAAAREAREEAGVLGRVHPYPVGIYLYPGSSDAPNHETPVTAYLLEVTKAGPPKEPERRPTWCTPPEARFLLAEGRDERFAREHDHILTTALARLA